jgi:hypothetical protein
MKYRFLILLLVVFSSCNLIISGSYPYSETYSINISREELISKIKEFKEQNIEYRVMTTFENGEKGELPDGLNPQDTLDIFYAIYFYTTDLNMTLLSVINMTKEIPTRPATIQLVSMTKSKNFGSWKTINTKDLSKEENAQIKALFETRILDKLGAWKHD